VINEALDKTVVVNFVNTETTVTAQNSGNLSLTLKPENISSKLELSAVFQYTIYTNTYAKISLLTGSWNQSSHNQPIYINVESNQNPSVPEFPFIVIPLLLSLLSVAIILTKRKLRICTKHA